MRLMHVVYICTSVLMNYECVTPILPFITITTKFLSKHCIKRVLDTEMNDYISLFQFYRENFLTSQSVDPKQPSHFHCVPSLKLIPKARCMTFQERFKGAHLSTLFFAKGPFIFYQEGGGAGGFACFHC
jgi:hypothetical protein